MRALICPFRAPKLIRESFLFFRSKAPRNAWARSRRLLQKNSARGIPWERAASSSLMVSAETIKALTAFPAGPRHIDEGNKGLIRPLIPSPFRFRLHSDVRAFVRAPPRSIFPETREVRSFLRSDLRRPLPVPVEPSNFPNRFLTIISS